MTGCVPSVAIRGDCRIVAYCRGDRIGRTASENVAIKRFLSGRDGDFGDSNDCSFDVQSGDVVRTLTRSGPNLLFSKLVGAGEAESAHRHLKTNWPAGIASIASGHNSAKCAKQLSSGCGPMAQEKAGTMNWYKRLGVTGRLLALTCLFVAGVAWFSVFAYSTLSIVKVKGPLYTKIVDGKDLVADILPPPEYVIETYLTCKELATESNPAQVQELVAKVTSLKKDFDDRHAYWEEHLPAGEMKDTLLVKSYEPAIKFFNVITEQLIPAVQAGDREKADAIVRDQLKPLYDVHRKAIDEVVVMANQDSSTVEGDAESTVVRRSWVLVAIGVITATVLTLVGVWVAKGIAGVLEQTVTSMEAATRHDYTQKVECKDGGELGRMTSALGHLLTALTDFEVQAADFAGQISAIGKSQAVIEFNLDGTIASANDNFLQTLGYSLVEIQGKHHSMFVDPEFVRTSEYQEFWAKLRRGEYQAGEFKRFGKGRTEDLDSGFLQPDFRPERPSIQSGQVRQRHHRAGERRDRKRSKCVSANAFSKKPCKAR